MIYPEVDKSNIILPLGPKKRSMSKESVFHLYGASLMLMHMAVYSSAQRSITNYGLYHATMDDSYFSAPFIEAFGPLDDDKLKDIVKSSKEMSIEIIENGSKASALVFMYSGCESCLMSVFKEAQPSLFYKLLEEKTASLGEFISKDITTILDEKIDEYIDWLSRQSLLKKTRDIFRLLAPSQIACQALDFKFSEEVVRKIESMRNDCAHGRIGVSNLSDADQHVDYLIDLGEFFINLSALSLNLPFSRHNRKAVLEELFKNSPKERDKAKT